MGCLTASEGRRGDRRSLSRARKQSKLLRFSSASICVFRSLSPSLYHYFSPYCSSFSIHLFPSLWRLVDVNARPQLDGFGPDRREPLPHRATRRRAARRRCPGLPRPPRGAVADPRGGHGAGEDTTRTLARRTRVEGRWSGRLKPWVQTLNRKPYTPILQNPTA